MGGSARGLCFGAVCVLALGTFDCAPDSTSREQLGREKSSRVSLPLQEAGVEVARWRQIYPETAPDARAGSGLAYDEARKKMVLFGGFDATETYLGDTWEWDGATAAWTKRFPAKSPSPRCAHAMVYDSARHEVLVFGGQQENKRGPLKDDLWAWDGTTWTERTSAERPSARGEHSMAFDRRRGRVVMFAGILDASVAEDTWEWDGAAWSDRTPARGVPPLPRPGARYTSALVFDEARDRTLLFGGGIGLAKSPLADTWEWDGSGWLQKFGKMPPKRFGPALAYDAARARVLLFGGNEVDDSSFLDDTWEWDGAAWTKHFPAPRPPSRARGVMAFDSTRREVMLFGGGGEDFFSDTWVYQSRGAECTSSDQCDTAHCVDGICCNVACGAACEACDLPGSIGTCVPVTGTPHHQRTCGAIPSGEPCKARACDGESRATCGGFVGAEATCRPARCVDGVATLIATCDNRGACQALQQKPCAPYVCGETECKTTCARDQDCAVRNRCDLPSGTCVPGAQCDGEQTVTGANGKLTDCAPFKCDPGGTCKPTCNSVTDCVAPFVCNSKKACVSPTASGRSTGCSIPDGGGRGTLALLLAGLAALAVVRGRARRHA